MCVRPRISSTDVIHDCAWTPAAGAGAGPRIKREIEIEKSGVSIQQNGDRQMRAREGMEHGRLQAGKRGPAARATRRCWAGSGHRG